MKETMENTWGKFQKELQEPSLCGACGQYYEENEQGDDAYHAPELCDANDEIKEEKKMGFAEYLNSIQPFTVGLMRSILANLPEDTQIVFGIPENLNTNRDFYNIELDWKSPDEDEEYLALTFFLKDNYDARQF